MTTNTPRHPAPAPDRGRRWRRRALAASTLVAGMMLLLSPIDPAGAQPTDPSCGADDEHLSVLQVEGRLNEVMVDFIRSNVEDVDGTCAVGLLLQLDSEGVTGQTGDLEGLHDAIEQADTPVEVWVGPTGSRAVGEAADLLAAADRTGLAAPSSRVEVTPDLAEARGVTPEELGTTRFGDQVQAERAMELGLVDSDASVIGDFVVGIPEVETRTTDDGVEPVTPAVFAKLPLTGQLMHTVASPAVAYLLFSLGLALLIFELYSAGVGVAGMVGAGCLVLGCYGLASLPTDPVGVALILFAMFGYAIDVQTGIPRVWTGIATVAFIVGSLLLFEGVSLSWITLMAAFIGMTLLMLRGMPVMVRSRFSTSTIDRGWLVGTEGRATSRLAPSGTVLVQDAPWHAEVNERAPIESGESIRVVAVDGFRLEVEAAGKADAGVQPPG